MCTMVKANNGQTMYYIMNSLTWKNIDQNLITKPTDVIMGHPWYWYRRTPSITENFNLEVMASPTMATATLLVTVVSVSNTMMGTADGMGRGSGRGRGKGKGKSKKPVGKGKEKASEADVEMKDDQRVHMWLQITVCLSLLSKTPHQHPRQESAISES